MGGCFSSNIKNIEEKTFHRYTDEYIVVSIPEYNFQQLAINMIIHQRLTSLANLKQSLHKQYNKKHAKIIRIRKEINILRSNLT